jgi:hypothetical protein
LVWRSDALRSNSSGVSASRQDGYPLRVSPRVYRQLVSRGIRRAMFALALRIIAAMPSRASSLTSIACA